MHSSSSICPIFEAIERPSARNVALAALLLGLAGGVQAGPLNDTGVEFCRTHELDQSVRTQTAVTATTTCQPMPVHGGQDARYGRDAAAVKGQLTKVGSSTPVQIGVDASGNPITQPNGFDFTKISNRGAKLPATAPLGTGPDDWGCTYDNNTGLMWEVKTYDADPANKGLRDKDWGYVWHNPARTYPVPTSPAPTNPSANGGSSCFAVGTCDTDQYTKAVNKIGMCGKTDWRLPTRMELLNIVDNGRPAPAIDPTFFPNTGFAERAYGESLYWTSTQNAYRRGYDNSVVYVDFGGRPIGGAKASPNYVMPVRLVRAGL
jgi:hypothetical protein